MKFSKYHGCGNDFIIGEYNDNVNYSELAKKVCNRHTGLGADGLILAKKGSIIEMVFYNADGSRGLMCGNGIRCLSKFIIDEKLDEFKEGVLLIKTLSGVRTVYFENGLYKVNMGKPDFNAKACGIMLDGEYNKQVINYKEKEFVCTSCFMTVDHLICNVNNIDVSEEEGNYLCNYPLFTRKINVNFAKIINRDLIEIKTYERGVGFTKACGSGSTATFATFYKEGLVNKEVKIKLEYGELTISIDENSDIFMKGQAELIAKNIEFNC